MGVVYTIIINTKGEYTMAKTESSSKWTPAEEKRINKAVEEFKAEQRDLEVRREIERRINEIRCAK